MEEIDYNKWVQYLHTFLLQAPRKIKKITDGGCGTGSISIRLARYGYQVTGIDLSQEMLAVAAEHAREAGQKITFVRQDIRQLVLGHCDALVCACDVLNYISPKQIDLFFSRVYAGLSKGGAFLFDISSSYKLREVLANQLFFEDRENISYFWRNHMQENSQKIAMELTFFVKRGEFYTRRDEVQVQYIHETDQILQQLRKVGFLTKAYDFGTLSAPHQQTERVFFAAYKPLEG